MKNDKKIESPGAALTETERRLGLAFAHYCAFVVQADPEWLSRKNQNFRKFLLASPEQYDSHNPDWWKQSEKKMKESEYLREIKAKITEFFNSDLEESEISEWIKRLQEISAECGVTPVSTRSLTEGETLVAVAWRLIGWIDSRLDLLKENRFERYPDGLSFSHKFKEVPQEKKNET